MTQQEQPQQIHQFECRGSAGEYFKLWMANLLLSILTLGIYSAWAKVRNRKYLYGSTHLDGANFHYTANPLSILLGRVLVVACVLAVFWARDKFFGGAPHIALLLLLPWALVRSLAFNARCTSYRNVRFGFATGARVYLGFYLVCVPFVFVPSLLIVVELMQYVINRIIYAGNAARLEAMAARTGLPQTLADIGLHHLVALAVLLLLPPCVRAAHRLKGSHMRWGEYQAAFNPASHAAYFAVLLLLPLCVCIAIGLITAPAVNQLAALSGPIAAFTVVLGIVTYALPALIVFALSGAFLFRLYWQGLALPGGGRIKCNFSAWHFAAAIIVVNYLAVILSLGLLHPWAKMRKMKYLAAHTALHMPAGALDEMLARASGKQHAIGEELDAAEGIGAGIDIA